MENKLATLRRLLRLHGSWLLVKLLGPDMVSKEDLAELESYGKLPSGDEVDLIGRAFSLGRLSAVSKKNVYSELELEELSRLDKFRNSNADKLAIREAKMHAAKNIQSAISRAADGASEKVTSAVTDLSEQVTTRDLIADEVTIAVKEKKTRQQLSSSLGNRLRAELTKDIKRIAVTEFHRAKQRGVAMAIANKVGIYKESDGVESKVSVVPNKGACKDCKNLYLDGAGNPKVFVLKDLVARGSNADPGVRHTVGPDGLRTGWKAVMPPAHPNCFCEVTYIPPGYTWKQSKLVSDIKKAYDPTSMSATIKPQGGNSYQKKDLPKPGNIPGLKAPSLGGSSSVGPQSAKPQPAQGTPPVQGQGDNDREPCPYNGDKACMAHGGNGAANHVKGGKIMQAHAEWERKNGKGSTDPQAQAGAAEATTPAMNPEKWEHKAHPDSVTLDHLANSDITKTVDLGNIATAQEGISFGAKRIDTRDNGSGLTKGSTGGRGMEVRHEVDAYALFTASGSDRCMPTTSRVIDGHLKSVQAWNYKSISAGKLYKIMNKDGYPASEAALIRFMLDKSTDKEKLIADLKDIAVMDIIMCNTDRHWNNVMVAEDFSSAHAIDHGFSFGLAYEHFHNVFYEGMNGNNMQVKPTPEKLSWMKNTSYDDLSRIAKNTEEWRVAQSYLRMKYALKILDEQGHLPYNEFGNAWRNNSTNSFHEFALSYIDEHAENPDSPDYETANYFRDLGIFMDPDKNVWGRKDATSNRLRGEQYSYEVYLRSQIYINKHASKAERQKLEKDIVTEEHRIKDEAYAKAQEEKRKASIIQKEMNQLDMERVDLEMEQKDLKDKVEQQDPKSLARYSAIALEIRNVRNKRFELSDKYYEHIDNADLIEKEAEVDVDSVRKIMTMRFVPPGQEKIYDQLRANYRAIRTGEAPPAKKDYSKVRPDRSKNDLEADIKRKEVKSRLEKLDKEGRKKAAANIEHDIEYIQRDIADAPDEFTKNRLKDLLLEVSLAKEELEKMNKPTAAQKLEQSKRGIEPYRPDAYQEKIEMEAEKRVPTTSEGEDEHDRYLEEQDRKEEERLQALEVQLPKKAKEKAVKNFEGWLQEGERLHHAKRSGLVAQGLIDRFGKLTDKGKLHAGDMIKFYKDHDPKKAIRYAHGVARNNGLKDLSDAEAIKAAKWIITQSKANKDKGK